jgi:hypothetical protein
MLFAINFLALGRTPLVNRKQSLSRAQSVPAEDGADNETLAKNGVPLARS